MQRANAGVHDDEHTEEPDEDRYQAPPPDPLSEQRPCEQSNDEWSEDPDESSVSEEAVAR